MNCTHFKSYYPSSDGLHKIAYYVRFPIGTVRGVVQISHGMCEYFRRYDDLAEFLTGLGFAVCGNDHLGHGDSRIFFSATAWEASLQELLSPSMAKTSQRLSSVERAAAWKVSLLCSPLLTA